LVSHGVYVGILSVPEDHREAMRFSREGILVAHTPLAEDRREGPISRQEELFAFVTLAIIIWPILAVGVVGGYGFLVWMYQLIAGPPGPPH
jgi:periplasmic nitrate reductase NapE